MLIRSKRSPEMIDVTGFDCIHHYLHMMEWLRRGGNYHDYIVGDIEDELYEQDSGAQVLSVHLKENPHFETKFVEISSEGKAIVSRFLISFPFFIKVKSSKGIVWGLDVDHFYIAEGMDKPGRFKLVLKFNVSNSWVEAS